jgi:hypothetical protein
MREWGWHVPGEPEKIFKIMMREGIMVQQENHMDNLFIWLSSTEHMLQRSQNYMTAINCGQHRIIENIEAKFQSTQGTIKDYSSNIYFGLQARNEIPGNFLKYNINKIQRNSYWMLHQGIMFD